MLVNVEDVLACLENKVIRVFIQDNSIACEIGVFEFYFNRLENDVRLEDFTNKELAEMIADTINNGEVNGLDMDEVQYYKFKINNIVRRLNKQKYNPVYEAYELLVDFRDNGKDKDITTIIESAIAYLDEVLE